MARIVKPEELNETNEYLTEKLLQGIADGLVQVEKGKKLYSIHVVGKFPKVVTDAVINSYLSAGWEEVVISSLFFDKKLGEGVNVLMRRYK